MVFSYLRTIFVVQKNVFVVKKSPLFYAKPGLGKKISFAIENLENITFTFSYFTKFNIKNKKLLMYTIGS